MKRTERVNPSIFPETHEGLLAKVRALTLMCPDKSEWRCPMGFIEYKLAPNAGAVREDVLDDYMAWLDGVRQHLREGTDAAEPWENGVPEAEQVERLARLVVEHLESLHG